MTTAMYQQVDLTLGFVIEQIRLGDIGLPDIQRPFVWPRTKVRDLFDSMYRGFPVGYLLFWANVGNGTRVVGDDTKQTTPKKLIVDGQQRLTSLYAVMTGQPVLREDYRSEHIQIAFRPLDGTFEVANAVTKKDPEFIPDISAIFGGTGHIKFVNTFLDRLRERREVDEHEMELLAANIDRVKDLVAYHFTVVELTENIEEEQVAEIFVRINSQGTPLNQSDFILTLMSVYWEKGRRQLEEFVRAAKTPPKGGASSPYNHFLLPDPDQMLRVSVGLAFRRARLQHVYSLLRGKDLETGQVSEALRDDQFRLLEEAQDYALNLDNWHGFFKAVLQAGYRRGEMITSKTGLVYAYALYLIGKRDFDVPHTVLRDIIARWLFMTALTGRYTSSSESVLEADLGRLREVRDADGFVEVLDRMIQATLTGDYWRISLPNDLATRAGRSPSLSAYVASLNLLGARVLFSKLTCG